MDIRIFAPSGGSSSKQKSKVYTCVHKDCKSISHSSIVHRCKESAASTGHPQDARPCYVFGRSSSHHRASPGRYRARRSWTELSIGTGLIRRVLKPCNRDLLSFSSALRQVTSGGHINGQIHAVRPNRTQKNTRISTLRRRRGSRDLTGDWRQVAPHEFNVLFEGSQITLIRLSH